MHVAQTIYRELHGSLLAYEGGSLSADVLAPWLEALGDMLFSRAGVRVRGGSENVRKDVAEASTLYWAYWRKNRPPTDLSHGWGSNSQWRASFRRDYRVGHVLYYNVDGKHDLGVPEPTAEYDDALTREERVELLTHRCFVTTAKQHDDLYPYDDRFRSEA